MVSKPAASTRPAVDLSSRVGEAGALVVARGDELAEQVVAGVAAYVVEVVGEPVVELAQGLLHLAELPHVRPRSRLGAAAEPKRSTRSWCSAGTPRISAMTVTGSRAQ